MQRRQFLATAALLAGSGLIGRARAGEADLFPIVETEHGRVRGLMSGGIAVFKGLRYGADTAGRNRFMPPQPVPKWAGVRDALDYGNIAPQIPGRSASRVRRPDPQRPAARWNGRGLPRAESVDAATEREQQASRDRALSRRRLLRRIEQLAGRRWRNARAFRRLRRHHRQSSSERARLSVSRRRQRRSPIRAPSACRISSLRCNGCRATSRRSAAIPNRVLIFGQSGGGAKVSHLLAMPQAQGLFHSAGVMSGSRLVAMTREAAIEPADRLLNKLGLTRKDIRKLQQLPFTTLLAAQAEVEANERSRGEAPRSFAPVMGTAIPRHPFEPDAPAMSAKMPLIVSTVLDERTYRESNFDMTWDRGEEDARAHGRRRCRQGAGDVSQ